MSASIECAGQCTALRHAVVPETVRRRDVEAVFDEMTHATSPVDALKNSAFDGVFESHGGTSPPPPSSSSSNKDDVVATTTYTKHSTKDAYFKIGPDLPSPDNDEMEEYWRKVVVDVTNAIPSSTDDVNKQNKLNMEVDKLSKWLNCYQPISLEVNTKRSQVFELRRNLFENASLVVMTIGSTDNEDAPPAIT